MSKTGGDETRPSNMYVNFIIKFKESDSQIPVGVVVPYGGSLPDDGTLSQDGWLSCDSVGIDMGVYNDLYDVIYDYYGGDGNNTIYLPDYRDRFLRGVEGAPLPKIPTYDPDAGSRSAPTTHEIPGNNGNKVGSIQADSMKSHTHSYDMKKDYHHCNYGSLIGPGVYETDNTSSHSSSTKGGKETRGVNVYLNYIIRYK